MPFLSSKSLQIGIAGTVLAALAIATFGAPRALAETTYGITCDHLQVTLSDDKNFYVFTATSSGDESTITGYTFNFGDQQSYDFVFSASDKQDHHTATVTHTYLDAGVYTPVVRVNTQVENKSASATSPGCQTTLSIGDTASALPNTGVSGTIGLFATASALGVVLHQTWLRHRRTKQPSA
jgi:hypothetical protein